MPCPPSPLLGGVASVRKEYGRVEQAIAVTDGRLKDGEPEPSVERRTSTAPIKHQYAGREWTSDHPLNIRISLPLGFGRYYITIVAGKERRARARLAMDKREHPLDRTGNVIFLFLIGIIATAGSMTVGYMLLSHLLGWSGRLVL